MVTQSQKPHPWFHRMAAILFGSTMELVVLPACLFEVGHRLDSWLNQSSLLTSGTARWAAVLCFAFGVPWLIAAIIYQHWQGDGTPFPLVPTRKLVIQGPYRYTRNPMALGAIFWLLGWAFLANSVFSLVVGVGGFTLLVLSYDHFIEEQELARRFGPEYNLFRRRTPFLFPRFPS